MPRFAYRHIVAIVFATLIGLVANETEAAAATLLGKPTFGSPDQPFATRRPVTPADAAAIQSYLHGSATPVFSTDFTNPAELTADWNLMADDPYTIKSCRRPANDQATGAGLDLKIMPPAGCHNHSAVASTGAMISKAKFGYGFFEARMKIANITGINNAFWITTDDSYEFDVAEVHYPNTVDITLHRWPGKHPELKPVSVGFATKYNANLADGFHDYGVLWTPTELVFEVDGAPVAALDTDNYIKGPAVVRFATAVTTYGGPIPSDPEGHDTIVKSVKVYRLQ